MSCQLTRKLFIKGLRLVLWWPQLSISELSDQNPWWRDKTLVESDQLIVAWEKSSFKWRPRIVETFRWDANVIYSLRGPRQVGKTTLLRLKVRELLRNGVDGRRFFTGLAIRLKALRLHACKLFHDKIM